MREEVAGEARRRGRGQVAIREVEAGGSSRESGRELQLTRTPRVLLGRCRPCAWGYRERELQLTRTPRVLLGPQLSEHVWDPAVDRFELVQARMTPPAEGNQGGGEIRGPTVVDHERVAGTADSTEVAVPRQDLFPAAGEAGARAATAVVAGLAQPATVELDLSAGAAQRDLFFLEAGGHGAAAEEGAQSRRSQRRKKAAIRSASRVTAFA